MNDKTEKEFKEIFGMKEFSKETFVKHGTYLADIRAFIFLHYIDKQTLKMILENPYKTSHQALQDIKKLL